MSTKMKWSFVARHQTFNLSIVTEWLTEWLITTVEEVCVQELLKTPGSGIQQKRNPAKQRKGASNSVYRFRVQVSLAFAQKEIWTLTPSLTSPWLRLKIKDSNICKTCPKYNKNTQKVLCLCFLVMMHM